MNTRWLWLFASLFFVHCGDETLTPAQIAVDLTVVQMPDRSVALEAPPVEFNLQIQNKGEEKLTIKSVKLQGDQNCAFEIEGPDEKELGENDSSFIRISYKPALIATDNVNLIIKSNSEKKATLRIPICGKGVDPAEFEADENDTDTEEPDENEDDEEICDYAPDDQPDCELDDTEGE